MIDGLMSNHPLVFQDDADYDRCALKSANRKKPYTGVRLTFRVNVVVYTSKPEDVCLLRVAERRRVNLS
jgi:hypothetical protein